VYKFILAFSILLTGCVQDKDLTDLEERLEKNIQEKMSQFERIGSFYKEPIKFEIHDLNVEGEDVTAAIRSTDPRIDGKELFLDVEMFIKSGDVLIKKDFDYFYLTDGIGKIDTSFYISRDNKKLIQPEKGISVTFKLRGWGELYPGSFSYK